MGIALHIDAHGLEAIADGYRDLGTRAYVLGPVGFQVRDRWLESERRLFASRPWPAKKASTKKRYRYPIAHFAAMGTISVQGDPNGPPLHLAGLLERTLTTAQAPGQRDSIVQMKGGLDVRVGLKARGPVAYGNFQGERHGEREARDPMNFDAEAHRDATGDVLGYMIGRKRR